MTQKGHPTFKNTATAITKPDLRVLVKMRFHKWHSMFYM